MFPHKFNDYPTAESINGTHDSMMRKPYGIMRKDDWINHAHEARLKRAIECKKDMYATKIQRFYKSYKSRIKLEKETAKQLNDLITTNVQKTNQEIYFIIKSALFHLPIQNPTKRTDFNNLIEFIISSIQQNIHQDDDDLNFFHKTYESHTHQANFDSMKATLFFNDKQTISSSSPWMNIINQLLSTAILYIRRASSRSLSIVELHLYIQFVVCFTSPKPWQRAIKSFKNLTIMDRKLSPKSVKTDPGELAESISSNILLHITSRLDNNMQTGLFLRDNMKKCSLDMKPSLLSNLTQLMTKIYKVKNQLLSNPKDPSMIDLLYSYLTIPCIILDLEKYSPQSIKLLKDDKILQCAISHISEKDIQNEGTPKLISALANMIHLAYNDLEFVTEKSQEFVIFVTKFLEEIHSQTAPKSNDGQLGPRCHNVTFNPIFGWTNRETCPPSEEERIKTQLCYLWTPKFVKILFKDLMSIVETRSLSTEQNISINDSKTEKAAPLLESNTNLIPNSMVSIRTVMARLAYNMERMMISPYSKTIGDRTNNPVSRKLIDPKGKKIALVCYMYYMSLRTLVKLEKEIMTALCMHDSLLANLWAYISSFGPNNGIRAFLDHLALYTKTSGPEFHILTLFCKCSSHIISILDDSEFYEKQKPFTIDDLVELSTFLNNFVFKIIWNNLIPNMSSMKTDPLFRAAHTLLTDLYKRDSRRRFAPPDHWLIKEIKISTFLKDLEAKKPVADAIITLIPHTIPHNERVGIFRKLVAKDKSKLPSGASTLITVHRSVIVEDGYKKLIRLNPQALKGLIRVKFINDQGLDEAGIDQDGVFKEFLEDTIKKVFDPAFNLFCSTSEQCLYPSPTSTFHEHHLSLFNFVGKMLGKAVYEGIVVDVPFASFFLSRVLGHQYNNLYSPFDDLSSLDPELYKSLTYIKHYEGDVSELDLTFSIDQNLLGKIETHEFELGGSSIPVTNQTRVRYIHSVADYRMRTQIKKQTKAFVDGFNTLIDAKWLRMFSTSEFQRLISGDNNPIDLKDLRKNIKYFGGFHNNHRIICWLWDILEKDFTADELKLFLKFVTSCSKPPLLGFANLEPPFSIRCVEVSDDQDSGDTVGSVLRGFFAIRRSDPVDRLPTSSTCFNLLKLPNYQRRSTLREKLRYAIKSNPGFELS